MVNLNENRLDCPEPECRIPLTVIGSNYEIGGAYTISQWKLLLQCPCCKAIFEGVWNQTDKYPKLIGVNI
jgi:hypothetical protein